MVFIFCRAAPTEQIVVVQGGAEAARELNELRAELEKLRPQLAAERAALKEAKAEAIKQQVADSLCAT